MFCVMRKRVRGCSVLRMKDDMEIGVDVDACVHVRISVHVEFANGNIN